MIKAGYQITIDSYSNDGDNRNSITISGLTKARTQYIIAMCKLFTSQKHGNMCDAYHDSPEVALAKIDMAAVASAYTDVLESDELESLLEEPMCYMAEFLGSDEFFNFRVFSGYKVHLVPTDLYDVTNDFV